jgi:hypothetical protein
MRRTRLSLLVLTVLALAACRHRDSDSDQPDVPVHLSRNADTTHYVMQPGDIRIASVDSEVDLALLGDTISGGLSAKTLAKVKHDTDTGAVKGTGFGADIEKMVKGTVQSALTTRVSFPLSAVKDVHYDGRKIVFDWNGKTPRSFMSVHVHNNKDALEAFSASDAQRFVDAVRARKEASSAK